MRRIINGKVYDTATADLVCDVTPPGAAQSRTDFHYENTSLYRSPRGQFFLAGEGGARSRWATKVDGGSSDGAGIELVEPEDAQRMAERACLGEEAFTRFFGAPEEG